jgi:ComF family protein
VPCANCQQQAPAFTSSIAPYLYTQPLDGFITRLKFSSDHCQLPLLAELMSESVQKALCQHGRPDALIPVPLHWRRQWQRGFNQAALLANQLARHKCIRPWNLKVQERWCKRRRATRAQLGLDRTQRHSNMRQAFDCSANLADLYVVIIDDVMTTGATAAALTSELLGHGARRVDVWCCARTPGPTG